MTKFTLDECYSIWQKFLDKIAVIKKPSESDLAGSLDFSSREEFEDYTVSLATNADTRLGDVFNFINSVEDNTKTLENMKINSADLKLTSVPLTSQITNWQKYKAIVTTPPSMELSESKKKIHRRIKRWFEKQVRRKKIVSFSLKELDKAISGLNKNSTGPDKISARMFQTSQLGKTNLLKALNHQVLSPKKLHYKLLKADLHFIPKKDSASTGKLRPISTTSRVACLIDRMVSSRLDSLLSADPDYSNKFGFMNGKNIEMLTGELLQKHLEERQLGKKSALVHADQSQAYDRVSYGRLLTKLYRIIKRSKNNRDGYFSVTLGYLYKWIDNREVKFRGEVIVLLRGLPQGSPLSCLAYVVYYDFSTNHAILYFFADDILLYFSEISWSKVESSILKAIKDLETWCTLNDALLNHDKTYIQFLHRVSVPSTDFGCPVTDKPVRSLGIWWDQNFNFAFHTSKAIANLKAKSAILKKLRTSLNFKLKNLTQIYKVYRSNLLFGGYWLYLLSDFQLDRLRAAFNGFTRSVFGFSRLVTTKLVYSVSGLPSLKDYLSYHSCIRRFESGTHWFTTAIRDRRVAGATSTRSGLRPSTLAIRSEALAKRTKWPKSVFTWIDKAAKCWSILSTRPSNCRCTVV